MGAFSVAKFSTNKSGHNGRPAKELGRSQSISARVLQVENHTKSYARQTSIQ